ARLRNGFRILETASRGVNTKAFRGPRRLPPPRRAARLRRTPRNRVSFPRRHGRSPCPPAGSRDPAPWRPRRRPEIRPAARGPLPPSHSPGGPPRGQGAGRGPARGLPPPPATARGGGGEETPLPPPLRGGQGAPAGAHPNPPLRSRPARERRAPRAGRASP